MRHRGAEVLSRKERATYTGNDDTLIADIRQILSSGVVSIRSWVVSFPEVKRDNYVVLWLSEEMLMVSSPDLSGCEGASETTIRYIGSCIVL